MLERIDPFAVALVQLFLQLGDTIAQASGQFVILFFGSLSLMPFEHGNFGFQFLDVTGHSHVGQTLSTTSLVKSIEGLVGLGAVGDILSGQAHAGFDSFGRIFHGMVLLITTHHVVQNIKGLSGRCRFDENLLESTLQRAIFLNTLAVFVLRRGADTLHFAARQGRLQHIGRIQRAWRATCSYDGMNLIHKENKLLVLAQFLNQAAQTFLKLSAILRASHQGRHIQGDNALVYERMRHCALHDARG